jgi:hypothetical protein
MEEDVTRRRYGMMLAADLAEGMQVFRLRLHEKPIPRVRAERHDTGQPALEVAEAHCPQKRSQIAAQGPHAAFTFLSGINSHDEENGGPRELSDDGLWDGGRHFQMSMWRNLRWHY